MRGARSPGLSPRGRNLDLEKPPDGNPPHGNPSDDNWPHGKIPLMVPLWLGAGGSLGSFPATGIARGVRRAPGVEIFSGESIAHIYFLQRGKLFGEGRTEQRELPSQHCSGRLAREREAGRTPQRPESFQFYCAFLHYLFTMFFHIRPHILLLFLYGCVIRSNNEKNRPRGNTNA